MQRAIDAAWYTYWYSCIHNNHTHTDALYIYTRILIFDLCKVTLTGPAATTIGLMTTKI